MNHIVFLCMKPELVNTRIGSEQRSIPKRLYKTALIPYRRIKVLYDRTILLPQIAKRIASTYTPQTHLDIGSGIGYFGDALQKTLPEIANIVSTDVTENGHKGKTPYVASTGYQLPFGDHTFDVSTIFSVLHHMDDPLTALKEAKRVSKEIVVQEDTYKRPWQKWLISVHVQGYRPDIPGMGASVFTDAEWQQLFNKAGLQVAKKGRIRRLGYPVPRYEYHLTPKVVFPAKL